jgi:hypothetical protein
MAFFLMLSSFWFTHFNESMNHIVVILCSTTFKESVKLHAFLTLALDGVPNQLHTLVHIGY